MKKKSRIILCILAVMIFGTAVRVYATASKITQNDLDNINSRDSQIKVAEILLSDMDKLDLINPKDVEKITVQYGKFKDENTENDVAISAQFGPNLTLASVYEKKNGTYDYLGELGTFYEIHDLKSVGLKNLGKDAVFILENADNHIGSYEKSRFLRGYMWNGKKFDLILSTPDQIKADWNKAWESDESKNDGQWERVTQKSKINFEDGNYPKIKVEKSQSHLKSNDTNAKNIPDDATYKEEASRDILEYYHWSDSYNKFILEEGIEKATGQKVAVIEYWKNLPYSLTPDFAGYNDKVRIARKDGTTEIVNESDLEITESKIPKS